MIWVKNELILKLILIFLGKINTIMKHTKIIFLYAFLICAAAASAQKF
jgi:hypothetical protein